MRVSSFEKKTDGSTDRRKVQIWNRQIGKKQENRTTTNEANQRIEISLLTLLKAKLGSPIFLRIQTEKVRMKV